MFPTDFVRPLASRVALLSLAALSGCASMDDFSWRKMNFEVFRTPANPYEVAAKGTDGAERVRAIKALHEPLAHGGSQEDQDAYILLLNHIAGADHNALCRMAAIECLRHYRDPRAADGLKDAYYRAGSFHSDTASVLRRQALAAIGEMGTPAGAELLVRVLREPPTEGADVDKDARIQERITAARALAAHAGNRQVAAALAEVMAKDDDIALQHRAHESLVAVTGQDLPRDPKAWNDYLNSPAGRVPGPATPWRRPALGDNMLRLVGWK